MSLEMFVVTILAFQLALYCHGIHRVLSKNLYVSHHGHDKLECGNWMLPCRSVRFAVKISSANDIIHVDYAEGKPYKECENLTRKENPTIMLEKSISFYGFNGKAVLSCKQTYPFFGINNTEQKISKIVFSDLSIASRGNLLDALYNIRSKFEVEFSFCEIEESSRFVRAKSLSCSIQVLHSRINSHQDPIQLDCTNLTARMTGSTFFSCEVTLSSTLAGSIQKATSDIYIYNCTFMPGKRTLSCDSLVVIAPGSVVTACNITITSSVFIGSDNLWSKSALMISNQPVPMKITIVLDKLSFENVSCHSAVVYIYLHLSNEEQFDFDLSFNITRGMFGNEGVVSLYSGSYHFSLCHFFHNVPMHNPDFPLIRVESSVSVKFENCLYAIYPVWKRYYKDNLLSSDLFYIVSYDSSTEPVGLEGFFTIACPQGYLVNLNRNCDIVGNLTLCELFIASCEQCPPKTYSLDRGIAHKNESNHIKCLDCPVGGNCTEGQVTSMTNFWGYRSNQTVTFLQCPPKYCCESGECKHYNSCHGKRIGTLCGKCPEGMSESLFDTKCKMNGNCTSVTFWPGISAYLIFYLLFFLYQEDIISLIQRRVIPSWFSPNMGRNFKPGGLIKIIFYYYQVANLVKNSVGIDTNLKFIDNMENVLLRTLNFLIINIPAFDCPFQDLRAVEKTLLVYSVGYSLLILLCFLYISQYLFKLLQKFRTRSSEQTVAYIRTMDHCLSMKANRFHGQMAGAFANISLLMYGSAAQLCLSLLHCVPVRDSQVLFLDGTVKCYQTFQYFLFAYMISTILPFCLVPVLGSYLLNLDRIGARQFFTGCIFPLPVCCYWTYLLVRNSSWFKKLCCRIKKNESIAPKMEEDQEEDDNVDHKNSHESVGSESRRFSSGCLKSEADLRCSKLAILAVLLGPFRPHKATLIFPSSHLPWEGSLILRRLMLIIVLTFVYDNRVKALLSLTLCLAISLLHVFVWPFKNVRDNVLETLSLGTHVIICGFSLIKSVYYGQYLDSSSLSLLKMINLIENLLVLFPIVLILSLVILFSLLSVVVMFRFIFQALFQRMGMFKYGPSVD